MKMVMVLLGLLLSVSIADAACTGASPTWTCPASSLPADLATLQSSGSFVRGDTVNVTGSTATWTSAMTITKGMTVQGPGRDSLTISAAGLVPIIAVSPDATAINNEETIKLDGFTFDAVNNTSTYGVIITGASTSFTKPFKKLVITNNRWKNGYANVIFTRKQVRGVIAGNICDRCKIWMQPLGDDNKTEWTSGIFPFAFDTADNLYFEDNTQLCSTTDTGDAGHITSGQGGRIVVRYNTWTFTNCDNSEVLDMHGFQNWQGGSGQTGTFTFSAYGNTVNNSQGFRFQNLRGSQSLTFNNVTTGVSGSQALNVSQYDAGCNSVVDATWPPPNGQVNGSYIWNNTYNGSSMAATLAAAQGTPGANGTSINNVGWCPPVENAQFWNLNTASCTSSACTAGIGRGTTAPTGTCTIGTAYWVASTSTPTVSSSVIQSATLYKCTSTNVWTVFYQPYTYPHPLRGGADVTPPAAPMNLRFAQGVAD